jgi:hypothetical protein
MINRLLLMTSSRLFHEAAKFLNPFEISVLLYANSSLIIPHSSLYGTLYAGYSSLIIVEFH